MRAKRLLAICDPEEKYALRLADYINEKKGFPLESVVYTDINSFKEKNSDRDVALLLLSEVFSGEKEQMETQAELVIQLLKEEQQDPPKYSLYKYQNADTLIAQMMELCAGHGMKNMRRLQGSRINGSAELIGVFSPVHRCGKTLFSLALGLERAKNRRTLYINLEDYAGFSSLFGQEFRGDLSDLIYFFRLKDGNFEFKRNSLITKIRNLEMIPPAYSPWDLYAVEPEEWTGLLAALSNEGEYETIILDIGSVAGDGLWLLNLCSRIYMPVLQDPVSGAKRTHFLNLMENMGQEKLLEHIQEVQLPKWELPETPEERLEFLGSRELSWWIRSLENSVFLK